MGGIDDQFELISAQVLEPVCRLKTQYLGHKNPGSHTDEVLMALTISALTNPLAELAQQQLPKLRGCDAHFTVILSEVDENLCAAWASTSAARPGTRRRSSIISKTGIRFPGPRSMLPET